MKKKIWITTALIAMAVSATACSKKQDTATTAATTEAVTEATTEAETTEAEEIEEDYMSGLITKIDGDILTVKNDDDQTEKNYDISKAEVTKEFDFAEGDWVEISFQAETTEDPVQAITLEVLESVIGQNTDPSVEGKIADASMNNISLEVDGQAYTILTSNAYIVGKQGIQNDQNATVTYVGDLDDSPMAVKVVMEDSYNTPEAEVNAFIGTVAQIGEDDENIVLESELGDFYTFVSDDIDFSQYEEGQTLQIEYTGTISAKEIPATKITKK